VTKEVGKLRWVPIAKGSFSFKGRVPNLGEERDQLDLIKRRGHGFLVKEGEISLFKSQGGKDYPWI